MDQSLDQRIDRLHAHGIVDLHFDLLMDLYEKRSRANVLATDFLPELEAGNIGVIGAAIYIEDRYLPEAGLRVGLDQIARLYAEVANSERFAICKSHAEIVQAREAGKIALLITMEGVEPLGSDLDLLRVFYELGVRVIGLTHARRNAAASGGVFASTGSSPEGLTAFGRDLVRECEALGMIVDLAHINPVGFEEILEITTKPPIISHTNARKYYDVERNVTDDQIRMVGERGGVVGVNAVLVSTAQGGDHAGSLRRSLRTLHRLDWNRSASRIGFDFFEFIYRQWSDSVRAAFHQKFTSVHSIPDLANHSHARNFTRKLIERGFTDEQIEKILFRNWMRILEELL